MKGSNTCKLRARLQPGEKNIAYTVICCTGREQFLEKHRSFAVMFSKPKSSTIFHHNISENLKAITTKWKISTFTSIDLTNGVSYYSNESKQ